MRGGGRDWITTPPYEFLCTSSNLQQCVNNILSERSDEGLMLEMSAFNLFTLANLPYELSW